MSVYKVEKKKHKKTQRQCVIMFYVGCYVLVFSAKKKTTEKKHSKKTKTKNKTKTKQKTNKRKSQKNKQDKGKQYKDKHGNGLE